MRPERTVGAEAAGCPHPRLSPCWPLWKGQRACAGGSTTCGVLGAYGDLSRDTDIWIYIFPFIYIYI